MTHSEHVKCSLDARFLREYLYVSMEVPITLPKIETAKTCLLIPLLPFTFLFRVHYAAGLWRCSQMSTM